MGKLQLTRANKNTSEDCDRDGEDEVCHNCTSFHVSCHSVVIFLTIYSYRPMTFIMAFFFFYSTSLLMSPLNRFYMWNEFVLSKIEERSEIDLKY